MSKKIMARFVPQAWINDHAVEVDGAVEFDVTEAIKKLGKRKALEIKDDDYDSDNLAIEAGIRDSHNGPFRVEVQAAIQDFYEE